MTETPRHPRPDRDHARRRTRRVERHRDLRRRRWTRPAPSLRPASRSIESAPGRAQFALALIDYRDNDLGSYLEVGTILFVRPEGGGEDGTFITHLPVTEEFTCVAGNQIWGFPKSVEQIEVTNTDTTSRWVLTMDGELVVDVTVPRGGHGRDAAACRWRRTP